LPPGFVLKTKADKAREKEQDDDDEEETLEEKIDAQRKALDLSKCTPITLELFQKWKADKESRRMAEVEVKRKDAEKKAAGSGTSVMSGRDLFRYDPTLFQDDSDADSDIYEVDEEYDPANAHHEDDEEDDINAKNYDSNAESEEDDGEERKGDAPDEDDEQGEEAEKAGADQNGEVAKAASAIDKSLFLDDDDVPDE
jgi:hypothetical protein